MRLTESKLRHIIRKAIKESKFDLDSKVLAEIEEFIKLGHPVSRDQTIDDIWESGLLPDHTPRYKIYLYIQKLEDQGAIVDDGHQLGHVRNL